MTDLIVPRWLNARASRLLAAIVEASIDIVGHRQTVARLSAPEGVRSLCALAGGPEPYEDQLAFVARALRTGLDPARLGLAVSEGEEPQIRFLETTITLGGKGGLVVALPTRAAVPAPVVATLEKEPWRTAPLLNTAWLSAAVQLAHGPLPAPFQRLAGEAGFGPRVVRALALCAEWAVRGAADDEARLRFALGAISGSPHGVSLPLYDRTIVALERVLHGPGAKCSRTQPLLDLWAALSERSHRVAPLDPERHSRREKRAGRALLLLRAGDAASPPRMPHRPRRRVHRDPKRYTPALRTPRALAALDGQGDFFAP